MIDILHPCVSFNKVNTFAWYKKRCHDLPPEHDPTDWNSAMKVAFEWDDGIPVGVVYTNDRPPFGDRYAAVAEKVKEIETSMAEILKARIDTYL